MAEGEPKSEPVLYDLCFGNDCLPLFHTTEEKTKGKRRFFQAVIALATVTFAKRYILLTPFLV